MDLSDRGVAVLSTLDVLSYRQRKGRKEMKISVAVLSTLDVLSYFKDISGEKELLRRRSPIYSGCALLLKDINVAFLIKSRSPIYSGCALLLKRKEMSNSVDKVAVLSTLDVLSYLQRENPGRG